MDDMISGRQEEPVWLKGAFSGIFSLWRQFCTWHIRLLAVIVYLIGGKGMAALEIREDQPEDKRPMRGDYENQ